MVPISGWNRDLSRLPMEDWATLHGMLESRLRLSRLGQGSLGHSAMVGGDRLPFLISYAKKTKLCLKKLPPWTWFFTDTGIMVRYNSHTP